MPSTNNEHASNQVTKLANENGWPLICDPRLRFVTPQLKAAYDVWEAKRGTRTMPARSQLLMSDLKTALPNLAFVSIVREGDAIRFKAKLLGSELDTFMGRPMTGQFLDEAVPKRFAEKWIALLRPALDFRVPTRTVGRVEFEGRGFYVSETLRAPLAEDGETPDVMMQISFFHLTKGDDLPGKSIADQLMAEVGDRALRGGPVSIATRI